tara:strand:+ start:213 stop:434 length:222 start_codon:yes stop_codon:yes gene_type:complete
MTTNKILIAVLGTSLWCSCVISKKYNNISKKLDMIVENSEKGKIDSLQFEIMHLGNKLDSMILEHDYGFTFTK